MLAEVLPADQRLAGNAVLSAASETGTILGPPLAGLIIAATALPALVIGLDALTFAVLALSYALAARRIRPRLIEQNSSPTNRGGAIERRDGQFGGIHALLADPRLLGLLGLSFAFFAAFGPVYVALPALLHDPARLGIYYTAFGIGSLLGASATGYLHRLRFTTVLLAVVLGFGLAMLPLALGAPTAVALPAFALAGAIWAPYTATSMALLQSITTDEQRSSVLAANSAVLVVAVPLGTSLGGPAVEHLGAQPTLTTSTFLIIALGVLIGLARPLRPQRRLRP